jgi:hypothetical protein
VNRALIDWDFGAHGIWMIDIVSEGTSAPTDDQRDPQNTPPRDRAQQFRPWSDRLSNSLLDKLQSWNDWGCSLTSTSVGSQFDDNAWDSFHREGRELAESTQIVLGDHWRVLWAANGAWHFVRFP